MEPVLAVDERLVLADRGPVHERHRSAGRRFVVAEALPSLSLGRPDEVRRSAAAIELRSRERGIGDVDPDPGAAEFAQDRQFGLPQRRVRASAEEDVGALRDR